MQVLLTGATGYIGKRLLPALLAAGHEVVCCVRDANRFQIPDYAGGRVQVVEADFLKKETLKHIPTTVTHAYYLIHSMSSGTTDFDQLEQQTADLFRQRMDDLGVQQVIYLSGIVNEENLSMHLESRKRVEDILGTGRFRLTTLRAGIILGSGSASFEIMRGLVEKLPVMIAPKWLKTRSQPIAVRNVIEFLSGVLGDAATFDQSYDIAGPDIMSYREMLLAFARIRRLRRWIITIPVLTPKLSSYWLYFVTSTSFSLAQNLVNSMKVEVIARPNDLHHRLGIQLL
ncbi:MAG: NAD(P)H-binding protein, partial [Saprospiraceae bacterium]|nr:NAD(P)H-binding protein [Saprospiraceae bacterium]